MPIWFQAVLGYSAADSGVRTFPYGAFGILAGLITGFLMSKTGHYVPFMWLGSAIFTVGCGLLHLLSLDSPIGQWLPIEIAAGLGFGVCTQIAFFPAQNVLPPADIATGISLVIFSQGLGGSIGLSAAGNIFNGKLRDQLQRLAGVNVSALLDAGASASGVRDGTPAALLRSVLESYNYAIISVFYVAVIGAGISFLASLGIKPKKIIKG
jgi:cyanate permease